MAAKTLTIAEGGRYGTRMLAAGDPLTVDGPKARVLVALGKAKYATKAKRPQLDHDHNGKAGGSLKQSGDDIAALRAEYQAKLGKRPFNGWDVDTLKAKIAEA